MICESPDGTLGFLQPDTLDTIDEIDTVVTIVPVESDYVLEKSIDSAITVSTVQMLFHIAMMCTGSHYSTLIALSHLVGWCMIKSGSSIGILFYCVYCNIGIPLKIVLAYTLAEHRKYLLASLESLQVFLDMYSTVTLSVVIKNAQST